MKMVMQEIYPNVKKENISGIFEFYHFLITLC